MSKNVIELVLILGFIVLCFFVGTYLATGRRKKKKARAMDASALPLSAFSTFDHPALRNESRELDPIAEAEIFAVYGKKKDAQEVLNRALAKQLITQQDIDKFWEKR